MQFLALLRPIVIISFPILLLSACFGEMRTNQTIRFNEVKDYLSPVKETYRQPEWVFENCREPSEALAQNLPYSYDEAIRIIKKMFAPVDQKPISYQAKQYIKALICADFVYAAFSYHYFGDDAGFADDTVLNSGWDSMPLNACYNIGNNNRKAVYCYERASFYLRLVKTLMGVNGKILSKDGVHSFPVLSIADNQGNSRPYLIDPYDPFVIIQTGDSVIPVFNQNINLPAPVEIYRTRRAFGESRLLVSKQMISSLSGFGFLPQYCSILAFTKNLVAGYLQSHPGADSSVIELPLFANGYILTDSPRFKYAIKTNGRPEGEFFTNKHYLKYYGK
jgi:hypothetical protein